MLLQASHLASSIALTPGSPQRASQARFIRASVGPTGAALIPVGPLALRARREVRRSPCERASRKSGVSVLPPVRWIEVDSDRQQLGPHETNRRCIHARPRPPRGDVGQALMGIVAVHQVGGTRPPASLNHHPHARAGLDVPHIPRMTTVLRHDPEGAVVEPIGDRVPATLPRLTPGRFEQRRARRANAKPDQPTVQGIEAVLCEGRSEGPLYRVCRRHLIRGSYPAGTVKAVHGSQKRINSSSKPPLPPTGAQPDENPVRWEAPKRILEDERLRAT